MGDAPYDYTNSWIIRYIYRIFYVLPMYCSDTTVVTFHGKTFSKEDQLTECKRNKTRSHFLCTGTDISKIDSIIRWFNDKASLFHYITDQQTQWLAFSKLQEKKVDSSTRCFSFEMLFHHITKAQGQDIDLAVDDVRVFIWNQRHACPRVLLR